MLFKILTEYFPLLFKIMFYDRYVDMSTVDVATSKLISKKIKENGGLFLEVRIEKGRKKKKVKYLIIS